MSDPTEELPRFEEVLTLGRKIVNELEQEHYFDTLGRWIAHYVAELIIDAENDSAVDQHNAKRKCFETILELWSHHSNLPSGLRPFEELEPILRTLSYLDPKNSLLRKFSVFSVETLENNSRVKQLLELAIEVDDFARDVVRENIAEAIELVDEGAIEWDAIAKNADADSGAYHALIDFFSSENHQLNDDRTNERERTLLQYRITRIEHFIELANVISDDLKKRLKELP